MSYDAATEMVRQAFVAQYGYDPALVDNWLRFIIEEERNRIIALLEAWVADDYGDFDKTLALIKGETGAL